MQSSPRKSAGLFLSAGLIATVGLAGAICTPALGLAEECPGHPDALGTSRVLVVDPSKIQRVGVMQYPQSLPLADKEVVLTFDDGPLPPHSTAVLDTLAAQCVKATFFLVGEMAREFPAVVRRIHADGHTIGTHTEHHPFRMNRMPIDKVREEIDRGIADVGGALWDDKDLAPFFRIPGLARTDAIEKELADRSLVVFSSDTVADDWLHRSSADIVRLAVSRLEARGRGILLLHDIHRTTANALPDLLSKLKAAGFHVVHIVPGTEQPAIAGTVPAGQAGSSIIANANTSTAEPTTADPHGTTTPEPNAAAQPAAAGVTDSQQAKVASDAPAPAAPPNADNVPHDNGAGQTPEAAHQVVAANAPPAAPNEAAPAPLYNQATPADRAATREAEGKKQDATDGPSSGNQVIAAIAPPAEQSATGQPAAAPSSTDQAVSTSPASPQQSGPPAPATESLAIAEPAPAPEETSDSDDPVWPRPVIGSLAEEPAELPIPDERTLSADYHPWRTVKLADGSQAAVYLALDAVPQWTDPPATAPASSEAQLPAPAVPYYFGGGEIETSIAE